jgi:TonB family protein
MGGWVPKVSNREKKEVSDLSVRIDGVRAGNETVPIWNGSSKEASAITLSIFFSDIYRRLPWFSQKLRRGPGVAPMASQDSCHGGTVSLRRTGVLLAVMAIAAGPGVARLRAQDSQSEITRRVKSKVQPTYPELARKMNLTGTVKVEVVVAPNGTVKEAKVVGGHPVLANAALDAVRKWRFEPAPAESSGIVNFKFEPHQ